jgi:hypothetical protein
MRSNAKLPAIVVKAHRNGVRTSRRSCDELRQRKPHLSERARRRGCSGGGIIDWSAPLMRIGTRTRKILRCGVTGGAIDGAPDTADDVGETGRTSQRRRQSWHWSSHQPAATAITPRKASSWCSTSRRPAHAIIAGADRTQGVVVCPPPSVIWSGRPRRSVRPQPADVDRATLTC